MKLHSALKSSKFTQLTIIARTYQSQSRSYFEGGTGARIRTSDLKWGGGGGGLKDIFPVTLYNLSNFCGGGGRCPSTELAYVGYMRFYRPDDLRSTESANISSYLTGAVSGLIVLLNTNTG